MSTKRDRSGRDSEKRGRKYNEPFEDVRFLDEESPRTTKALKPLTNKQKDHLHAIDYSDIVFAVGPAGTGKTYLNVAYAAQLYAAQKIKHIYITRPACEAGEKLGFLKGDLEEKYAPYLLPVKPIAYDYMGRGKWECGLRNESIVPVVLGYCQGMTLNDGILLFDEAENCTPQLFKLLMTRVGRNCKVLISGDMQQQYSFGACGLQVAIEKLEGRSGISVVRYTKEESVRSDICRLVLDAWDEESK